MLAPLESHSLHLTNLVLVVAIRNTFLVNTLPFSITSHTLPASLGCSVDSSRYTQGHNVMTVRISPAAISPYLPVVKGMATGEDHVCNTYIITEAQVWEHDLLRGFVCCNPEVQSGSLAQVPASKPNLRRGEWRAGTRLSVWRETSRKHLVHIAQISAVFS